MRIAIVEPYYGGSHQAWADGYRAHSEHEVRLFTHEARFWKWRMHGSYVTLAEEFVVDVVRHGPFDLILASDMLHLPAFLGSVGSARHSAAVALYMHENQLTYPLSPRDTVDEAYAMINWAAMTVADAVFFNSQFHHDIWFEQIPGQLRRFPDYKHSDLLPAVQAKADVLGVGVDLARLNGAEPVGTPAPLVLWNQRWDFDKGPDRFADAMIDLARSHDFVIGLAGEEIGEIPAFTRLQEVLAARMFHVGYAPDDDYRRLLGASDVVVSTATQEFFGIAITEAVYAGAFPVLPSALVYPERIPGEYHEACLYGSDEELGERLGWALEHPDEAATIAAALKPAMGQWDWAVMAPRYDEMLAGVRSEA